MELKNSVIIVTGAGSGVGRAIAVEYAKKGARVVCCGRRLERLEETVELIKKEGGEGLAFSADITISGRVREVINTVLDSFGRIDVLFNNAGSFRSISGVVESEPEIWWEDVRVNLFGTYLMTKEVLPSMMARDAGIIINMDGGRPPGGSAYGSSKAAVAEFTKILLKELAVLKSSIMVFLAGPGLVRTEMTELQAESEAGRKWIPSTYEMLKNNRVRKPQEIAAVTARLIELARPEWNGMSFGPDTDFEQLMKN